MTTFLGAPFALAACRDVSAPQRFPGGQIVGQSAQLGHILRENRLFEVPADYRVVEEQGHPRRGPRERSNPRE